MANQSLKGSEKIALFCFGFGAAVAAAIGYYIFPGMRWYGYLIIAFLVAAGLYAPLLQIVANEKIIDRGDWPVRKPPKLRDKDDS